MNLPAQQLPTIDYERERIRQFTDNLEEITHVGIRTADIDVTDPMPVASVERRFRAFDLQPVSSLILEPEFSWLEESGAGGIEFIPRSARGGKRSAHGVFFGDLIIGDNEVSIAVKPHAGGSETLLDDHFNALAVQQLGFYTLQPFGLMIPEDEDRSAYSMTILDEGLTTLDSIDWTGFYPRTYENPGMTDIWREIGSELAHLHASGSVAHGDMAARNIAVSSVEDERQGSVFFIDWEHAKISNRPPRDAEVRWGYSYADLKVLLRSMYYTPNHGQKAGIGIFYHKDADLEDLWWGFKDVVFDEYCIMRRELAEAGTHSVHTEIEVEEELEELHRSLKAELTKLHNS